MSFQLKISNNLEKLSETLSKDLISNESPVLSKVRIITQTTGMNRWLSINLATKNRVFANFEYLKPNAFIDEIFKLAGLKRSKIYATENMKWQIFLLLDSKEFKNEFSKVSHYYKNDNIKRLQLATKVADLFDQYSIYRPEYIKSWNRNHHPNLDSYQQQEGWQSWLWQSMKKKFPEENNDRVTIVYKLKDIIQNDREFIIKLVQHYPKVSVFGLSVVTMLHIELFKLLSEHIQVNFYIVNPSPETYWYDTKSESQLLKIEEFTQQEADELLFDHGNELLMNYGKILRDTFLMLFDEKTLDTLDNSNLLDRPNDTLLHKIQNDIYHNSTDDKNIITTADLEDSSLQISSSYTQVRELEALHNYLLNLFEKETNLVPKDVIVLTTDIDLYTPFIKAVFDNVPKNNRIPYSIADRAWTGGDNIVGVIDLVLNLSEEEFTSENVVQLLDSAYIRRRYGINNTDTIRDIVRESNIRTGIHGNKNNDTYLVSFNYGIKRLIYGYAIKGGEEYGSGENSFYPVDSMEGETAREVMRFVDFIDDLTESIQERKGERTISEWKDYLIDHIVNRFIYVEDENDREYKYVIDKLASLDEAASYFDDKIDFDIFKKSINDLLFSESRSGDFITGSVTFSSLIPMRSLPFKVVAVLGLDNKKFPRKNVEPEFNLMNARHHRGDRNIKDNDKHLFLETLLAADEYLYLSYIGHATKDNAEIPPSLLIDELINYVEDAFEGDAEEVKKMLVTHHPLHSFSHRYNTEKDKKLYSFSHDEIKSVKEIKEINREKEEHDFSTVTLDELIWFFKNPFKWYYNKTLKIYFKEDEVLLPEFEKFDLDSLDKYLVKTTILNASDDTDNKVFIDREKKTGGLPLANMAEVTYEAVSEEVKHVKEILDNYKKGASEEKVNISIPLDGMLIEGVVSGIFNDRCLAYSLSGKNVGKNLKFQKGRTRKYILEAWIRHIALVASGQEKDTLFAWNFDDDAVTIPANVISQIEAKNLLSGLTTIFIEGHKKIIPFDPAVGFNIVYYGDDVGKSFHELRKIGETGFNKEFYDDYYKMEIEKDYFDEDAAGYQEKLDTLQTVSETVWNPLFNNGKILK